MCQHKSTCQPCTLLAGVRRASRALCATLAEGDLMGSDYQYTLATCFRMFCLRKAF